MADVNLMDFNIAPESLEYRAYESWMSARQVWWLVTEEVTRVNRAVRNVRDYLKARDDKSIGNNVKIFHHDRWSGFYTGLPPMAKSKDKSTVLGTALQMAVMTDKELQEADLQSVFDPKDDIIFIFTGVIEELREQPPVATLLKNIMRTNACSAGWASDRSEDEGVKHQRGVRMIILVTPTSNMPESIPELKPEIVPLPNHRNLERVTEHSMGLEWDEFKESSGKKGVKPFTTKETQRVVDSLCGMTETDAEEALTLSIIRQNVTDSREIEDMDEFLNGIEGVKAKAISKIPGLTYIRKTDIITEPLPGYEALTRFLDERIGLSIIDTALHDITPLRGLALGGAPGGGKTEIAKYIARRLGRICLIWDIGASKGSLVGQSEDNCRKVIQAARAMKAFVLCDDVDKGGISKSKDYSGDGGTSGNMIAMLLTEMSDPKSDAIYAFTFNRVPDMPELLRPGRVDERFYVERPNATTRKAILLNHIARVKMEADEPARLDELAQVTDGWTGAELAHVLIRSETIRALANSTDRFKNPAKLSVDHMLARAESFIPMCKQRTFADDIARMEEACSQFVKIGNLPDVSAPKKSSNITRSQRKTQAVSAA